MTAYLHIEIFCPEQGPDILSLLTFPSAPLRPANVAVTFHSLVGTQIRRSRSHDLLAFLQRAAKRQTNQIQVAYAFAPYQPPGYKVIVTAVTALLYISPTNQLWLPTSEWKGEYHGEIWDKFGAESAEMRLKTFGIDEPSFLYVTITLQDKTMLAEARRWLWSALPESFPDAVICASVIGGVLDSERDYGYGRTYHRIWTALTGYPGAYLSLGERFGTLQPIMFAKASLCQEVAQVIGDGAEYREIADTEHRCRLGFLHLADDILENEEVVIRLQPWLVPLDETTIARTVLKRNQL